MIFKIENNKLTVDVQKAMKSNIFNLEQDILLKVAELQNEVTNLVAIELDVEFENEPEFFTVDTAPESMTVKELKENNNRMEGMNLFKESILAKFKRIDTSSFDWTHIKVAFKNEYPMFSEQETALIFEFAANQDMGSQAFIFLVDEAARLTLDLRKMNKW